MAGGQLEDLRRLRERVLVRDLRAEDARGDFTPDLVRHGWIPGECGRGRAEQRVLLTGDHQVPHVRELLERDVEAPRVQQLHIRAGDRPDER